MKGKILHNYNFTNIQQKNISQKKFTIMFVYKHTRKK